MIGLVRPLKNCKRKIMEAFEAIEPEVIQAAIYRMSEHVKLNKTVHILNNYVGI